VNCPHFVVLQNHKFFESTPGQFCSPPAFDESDHCWATHLTVLIAGPQYANFPFVFFFLDYDSLSLPACMCSTVFSVPRDPFNAHFLVRQQGFFFYTTLAWCPVSWASQTFRVPNFLFFLGFRRVFFNSISYNPRLPRTARIPPYPPPRHLSLSDRPPGHISVFFCFAPCKPTRPDPSLSRLFSCLFAGYQSLGLPF